MRQTKGTPPPFADRGGGPPGREHASNGRHTHAGADAGTVSLSVFVILMLQVF